MIVPSNKLLYGVAGALPLTLLPAVFAAGQAPFAGLEAAAFLAMAAVSALAALDAALALGGSRRPRISLPPVVRLAKDSPGFIPVLVGCDDPSLRRIKVGLPLPPPVRSGRDEMEIILPGDGRDGRALWPCHPRARGSFVLNRCFFERASPLGLWLTRGSAPSHTELRVYPGLAGERKRLAAVFLNRGNYGLRAQRMVGQGREFEKLRDYMPGDSFDDINWKATAKRGRPITKLYQIERTQEIYVLLDSSRLSARSVEIEPVLERYLASALTLGLVAERQGDRFGLVTFDSRVRRFIRAAGGRAHYDVCRDALYTVAPRIVTPNYDELAAFVRMRLRRRALLIVLTDLGDPMLAESFLRSVELIRRQHLILVFMIRRPGARELFSGADAAGVDSLYGKLAGHIVWQDLRGLEKNLQRHGIGFALVDQEKLSAQMVCQYMNIKTRQAL
ncbi:MAG: DUF58 domain-containing protein [Verrucomicrobiota bacterium]|nr:DUF58 domain-containing protein [Verrucomicrobiota bacterium]